MVEMMTVKQVSEIWGIFASRITKLCREGKIQGIDYFAEIQPIELKTEVYRNILPLSNMLSKPSSP